MRQIGLAKNLSEIKLNTNSSDKEGVKKEKEESKHNSNNNEKLAN